MDIIKRMYFTLFACLVFLPAYILKFDSNWNLKSGWGGFHGFFGESFLLGAEGEFKAGVHYKAK